MDPLSIAAGGAGFIALGITACDGIIKYCRAYRSQDNDMSELKEQAERLQAFLDEIARPAHGGSVTATELSKCSVACEICINRLKKLVAKYNGPIINDGIKRRGKAALRQLQYPFEKDRVDFLKAQLHELRSEIQGSLLLLNL